MNPPVAGGVFFMGGNGHSQARLDRARAVLAETHQIALYNVEYPGFEDRACAGSFDEFVARIAEQIGARPQAWIYATGIGGLVALCLRSRELAQQPMILQAPVLWGLEHRWMPKIARLGPIRRRLPRLFALPSYQHRFVKKQFQRELTGEEHHAFFDGYARCAAFGQLFGWLDSPLLRQLEGRFQLDVAGLDRIVAWWGGRDRVVGPSELEHTARALGVSWPMIQFDAWGHYPMIEEPEAWADAIAAQLAKPVPRMRVLAQDGNPAAAESEA